MSLRRAGARWPSPATLRATASPAMIGVRHSRGRPLDVERIHLLTFPETDRAFRVHVEAAVASLGDRPLVAEARRDVEALVRAAYPLAGVFVRDRVTEATPTDVTLSAYRDGRGPSRTVDEGWSIDPSLPRFEIDESGTYVGANAAAADLVGVPVGEIVGSMIGRFTRHEADPAAGLRAFEVLAQEGLLESTAVVVRPDGTESAVDYRITASPEGTYVMTMRVIAHAR